MSDFELSDAYDKLHKSLDGASEAVTRFRTQAMSLFGNANGPFAKLIAEQAAKAADELCKAVDRARHVIVTINPHDAPLAIPVDPTQPKP